MRNFRLTTNITTLNGLRLLQQGSSSWHEGRKGRLTASDAAKALNCSPYETQQQFVQTKKKHFENGPDKPTAAQQRGIAQEKKIVDSFLQQAPQHGFAVSSCTKTGLWVHPGEPWLAAYPDRLLVLEDGAKIVLEVKCYSKPVPAVYPQFQGMFPSVRMRAA